MEFKKNWKTYAFWIILSEAVGGLAGWLTRDGTRLYNTTVLKPPLSPPAILFPIVWAVLYVLMGLGAARVYLSSASGLRSRSLILFLSQLAVNFFWSLIFFNLEAFGAAFFWLLLLWVLVLLMTVFFLRVDPIAGYLQIPYLLWTTFAAYLNYAVWQLNK